MPDKTSGDLRFFTILRILAEAVRLVFVATNPKHYELEIGRPALTSCRDALTGLGIHVYEGAIISALKANRYDIVLFEFHYVAFAFQDLCRRYQPVAKMIIDSVDVHFNRLEAKAKLTGDASDIQIATRTKANELKAYRAADAVITVSEEDRSLLTAMSPRLRVEVIPNIHVMPSLAPQTHRASGTLVFVGGFRHDPNIDAMLFFCHEVFPLIRKAVPHARIQIIGSHPPTEISALAGPGIEVLGYVPDTGPYLNAAEVSVAPLRYGGGMKGKVGEAMSHGLPVVTTSIGAEGFGLTPGKHLLVGDDAAEFAAHVISLLSDAALRQRIGDAGREFIRANYSEEVVGKKILPAFRKFSALPGRKSSPVRRFVFAVSHFLETRLLWRFRE